jgi:8-oxo-dGTP pyrophosphatase MutT (NUDIX family)
MFKLLKRNTIYKDKWLTFYQDEIELPDGSHSTYAWVDRQDGVRIAVVTPDRKILLNKEYRYVIDAYSWELPGGGIDEGEALEDAAKRELFEETGIRVDNVEKLGEFYALHSFNNEKTTLFMAEVEQSEVNKSGIESSEHFDDQRFFTFKEVEDMIDNGLINAENTANAAQIVMRRFT